MSRFMVSYAGTAPGMGEVGRYFDSRERAEQWARQCGVFGRASIVDCDAAPDLLAALEDAERVIRWAAQESAGRVDKEKVGGWLHHADLARAAIAKAKGE